MDAPTKEEIDELQNQCEEYLRVPQYKSNFKKALLEFFKKHHDYVFELLNANLPHTEVTEPHRPLTMEESTKFMLLKRRFFRGW